MNAPKRPDIMVICDRHPEDLLQRFQWRDGVWIPKDTSGEMWVRVGGPQPPFATAEEIADAPAGRDHLHVRCDLCGLRLAMDWDRAQLALTAMWVEAEAMFAKLGLEPDADQPLKLTLSQLQGRYDKVPPWAVRALPGRHADDD